MSADFARQTMTFKERFQRYCQWTTLHGFNFFVYPERSRGRTLFWLVIILLSAGLGLFVVGTNISDFASSTVSYDLDTPTLPLDDVFFPSLVLCNMNQMRSSFVWALVHDPIMKGRTFMEIHQLLEKVFVKGQDLEISKDDEELIDLVLSTDVYNDLFDELLEVGLGETVSDTTSNMPLFHHHRLLYVNQSTYDREEEKRTLFLNIATQFRYGEMVSRINFAGYGAIIDISFSSDVSDTCMWVTPLVKQPKSIDFKEVLPSARNGINNGLKLLLDAEVFDYASPIASKAGFVFTVLHHLDIAILKQTGSIAMPGQAVQVAITPTLTSSINSIKYRFDPSARQCYFEDEISFTYLPSFGYRYEMSNCLYEASVQQISRECDCIPSFVAAYLSEGVESQPICEGPGKHCMSSIMDDIGAERFITFRNDSKECLAPCHDQTHQFLVTSSAYPNKQSFHLGDDFCLILNKLRVSCANEKRFTLDMEYPTLCRDIDLTESLSCDQIRGMNTSFHGLNETTLSSLRKSVALYSSENLVALDIYIRDPYVRLYMRREKITIISFIGNIGGLLGLFMGFSFISMIEVFYIFLCGSVTTSTQKSKWAELSGIIGGRKGRAFDMKHYGGGGSKKSVMPYS